MFGGVGDGKKWMRIRASVRGLFAPFFFLG
jgi:hypothetical protein